MNIKVALQTVQHAIAEDPEFLRKIRADEKTFKAYRYIWQVAYAPVDLSGVDDAVAPYIELD